MLCSRIHIDCMDEAFGEHPNDILAEEVVLASSRYPASPQAAVSGHGQDGPRPKVKQVGHLRSREDWRVTVPDRCEQGLVGFWRQHYDDITLR